MSEEIIRQDQVNDNAIKFMGKAPPQFYEAMKQMKQEKQAESVEAKLASQKDPFADLGAEEETEPQPRKKQQQPQPQPQRPQGRPRPVGSPQLEELLAQLRPGAYTYDEIKLPSLGVFYNGNDAPQDGVLHLRPMTGEEEQILATPRYIKKGAAINMIFQRCIRETIKPDELLSVDRTYLLIALRSISYGHEYEVEIKCPDCDKKFSHTIRLDQLMVDYCPPDFAAPLTDVLPKSGLNFTWHLPKGKDENLVTEYREKRVKEYNDASVDDSLLYRIALMVENIEGVKDKTELMILLKKLPIQDVSYLRGLALDPPFGVDTKCGITCSLCYHDFEVELPLEAGFFFPRHKKKKEPMTTDSDSGTT